LIKIDCPGEEKGCSPIFVALEGSNLLIDQTNELFEKKKLRPVNPWEELNFGSRKNNRGAYVLFQ
jgi:hypothetical protein